jgi:hypothetical protein
MVEPVPSRILEIKRAFTAFRRDRGNALWSVAFPEGVRVTVVENSLPGPDADDGLYIAFSPLGNTNVYHMLESEFYASTQPVNQQG